MNEWRNYLSMSRDDLIERLRYAEDVCVRYAWTAVQQGDRADACAESWQRWARLPGVDVNPKANRDLIDSEPEMIAARRATRAAVMTRIRAMQARADA